MTELVPILITALLSPLFLKFVEWLLNKNSEQTKAVSARIEGLSARVDELREKNTRQEIEIAILKNQLEQKDRQIQDLQREIKMLQDTKQDN